jgi:transcription termination factor Rho
VAADALEQSVLESKDREQLMAIANALGVKSTSRAKKADLIQKILEQTGAVSAPEAPSPAPAAPQPAPTPGAPAPASPAAEIILGEDGEPLADWEVELLQQGISLDTTPAPVAPSGTASRQPSNTPAPRPVPSHASADQDGDDDGEGDEDGGAEGSDGGDGDGTETEGRNRRRRRRRNKNRGEGGAEADRADGPRPDVARVDPGNSNGNGNGNGSGNTNSNTNSNSNGSGAPRNDQGRNDGQRSGANAPRQDRNDRYEREAPEPGSYEPITVSGYLDLREEGYGFLRVNGYLASRDDAYIPVKLTRQFGLRRGDHVTGLSRAAGRNEKNPALLEVQSVNGRDPELARDRPRFEDLTPLFPDTKLRLENTDDPTNMTARIIDLICPIGMGQRGIIVSPPKAGKTTIMKTIATSIERNHPDVKLIVLLIDERPEEVTDMRRTVKGEVISSTFDRPSEEHTHVAELCIEKAKRLVEQGEDVVIILDGITRLARAYNLAAPPTGRIMSGGIDAGALYPPKKFFGAARNVEEGGSLTILATALVDTNSRMDDAIFEEFKGTGNMELRLDRRLAERRVFPAIDVDASSTRHEELLFTKTQLQMVWKLRRVLSGLAADGNAAPGLELLIDRLKTFRTNDEFLTEISKQPAM